MLHSSPFRASFGRSLGQRLDRRVNVTGPVRTTGGVIDQQASADQGFRRLIQ